jgi:membrane dipeptidase
MRAQAVSAKIEWFDGHLDLTYLALHGRDLRRPVESCGGTLQPATVTFPSLAAGGVRRAISTIFVRRKTTEASGEYCFETPDQAWEAGRQQVAMHRQWEREGSIEIARRHTPNVAFFATKIENRKSKIENPLQVTLALEGAACLRHVEDFDWFYEAGVRMVSLAWGEGSKWAGGDQVGGEISAEGRELVKRLDELGVVHDVSHLSERAFWTLLEIARGPVVASHSNCRALLPGAKFPQRHLSDEQLRALAGRKNARVGVCLFSRFLVPAAELAVSARRAVVADVLRHMGHVEEVTGRRDLLALGSDFDSGFGADMLPADLQGPDELWRLAEALRAAGWTDPQVRAFACGWEGVVG